MRSSRTTAARVAGRNFLASFTAALSLALLSACSSPDPHKTFSDAASTAASARMIIDARAKGHVTHDYTERLLEAERQEAHALASQLSYERLSAEQRPAAMTTMSRLALVLDELATDERTDDDAATARRAPTLDTLKTLLDSLSAPTAP